MVNCCGRSRAAHTQCETARRAGSRWKDAQKRLGFGAALPCYDGSASMWSMTFDPPPAQRLSGAETFEGIDASVLDFWKFAMSDLRTNNVRGYLAEFLVARAVGSEAVRVEWDPWDITAPDGTKIEVKSSGLLQAWAQKKLSVPSFKVSAAFGWDAATGEWSDEQAFNADVYVFCLHAATTHDEYDPLAVSQWRFYVAGRAEIEARAGAQMGLSTLMTITGDYVTFDALRDAITAAARRRPVQATEES